LDSGNVHAPAFKLRAKVLVAGTFSVRCVLLIYTQ
jgi:hypothetical protein